MSIVISRAVGAAVLAGAATFVILGPGAGYGVQIWAVLVAWASFHRFNGKFEGLKSTLINNLFGAILGWLALILVTQLPYGATIGLAAWAGVAVAITIGGLVFASKLPALGEISVSLLGYATILGLALGEDRSDKVLTPSLENPLVIAALSLIAGAILAFVAEAAAEALRKYIPLRGQRAETATSA